MDLQPLIDRLARHEPTGSPFISVYLDSRPDQVGRDKYDAFVRSELHARAKTYRDGTPERQSFDRDTERIVGYLAAEARPQANGIAIFACAGAGDVFEAVQLDVPIEESEVFVGRGPHLYPLAALTDRYRRHAAVLLDSHTARIYVFGLGTTLAREAIESDTMPKSEAGGWSQARYQRHVENFHLHHVKDVVDALDRIVRQENVDRIAIAGNEVAVPLFRAQLPKHLEEKVADVLRLDIRTAVDEVLRATLDAVQQQDAREDADKVRRLLDAYRAGGLGTVGVDGTLAALDNGQVHELLISATPNGLRARDGRAGGILADELVAKARQTDARVTFIEDAALLADVGGVGALLRYRLRRAA